MTSNKKAWLAPEFLGWDVYSEGGSIAEITSEMFRIPHAYVDHATKLLASPSSDLNRADAINNLKKALYHRVETLNELHNLDKFSYLNPPKNIFRRLETYNLLKPIMTKHLADLRGDIEHKYATPPSVEKCNELAEYVWYFLRSTDPFIRIVQDDLVFSKDGFGSNGEYWVSFIYIQIPEKSRDFIAQLPQEQLSLTNKDDWIEVEIDRISTEAEHMEEQKSTSFPLRHAPNATDLHLSGTIIGPIDKLMILRQRYFEAY